MGKRDRNTGFNRPENTRAERKVVSPKELLTFSFKDLDNTQPIYDPQSIESWNRDDLLKPFMERLKELSRLTRDEATIQQQPQIKIYGGFPPPDKTEFSHPQHVNENVEWAVIKKIKGQKGVVAGYLIESTFYIVFFDKDHKFWISEKKHT